MSENNYPSRALRALRRGEITIRTYLADRVHHATSPLADRLTPRQLRLVAKVLRARLRVDPVRRGYVERLWRPGDAPGPPASSTDGVR